MTKRKPETPVEEIVGNMKKHASAVMEHARDTLFRTALGNKYTIGVDPAGDGGGYYSIVEHRPDGTYLVVSIAKYEIDQADRGKTIITRASSRKAAKKGGRKKTGSRRLSRGAKAKVRR